MPYRTQVQEALKRADNIRVAKGPFDGKSAEEALPPSPGQAPPGGAAPSNRQIPKDHKFDPKALKPLAKMLWAMSVSLGHALQAYRLFNRVKSSTVSPDGMVGGRGYIMKVTELRQKLYDACEALSAVSDTVHDELNAPHWKPKVGELTKEDFDSIERLIGESENMLDNSEDEIDEEEKEVEKKGKPSSSWVKQKTKENDKEPKSDIPTGGDMETVQKAPRPDKQKQASVVSAYDRRSASELVADTIASQIVRDLFANSSVNPDTLPGPRVDHFDRGDSDQTGPMGTVNEDEPVPPNDEWAESEGVSGEPMSDDMGDHPVYQWDGGRSATTPVAESALPDSNNSYDTRTEGYDFGIGRGNGNDAHGQGAGGYGEGNPGQPSNKGDRGVYGPEAQLPSDPGGKTHDNETPDSMPSVENSLPMVFKAARNRLRAIRSTFVGPDDPGPSTDLPGDSEREVARADYYTGPKDNDEDTIKGPTENPVMAQSGLPESSPPAPPRPLVPRPSHFGEHEFASTELPGDDSSPTTMFDKDLPYGGGYRYEHMDEPYTKWDDSTHNMRPDPINQRDPIQGPYAKPESGNVREE